MEDNSVVAMVPARGGSTTIPQKNLKQLGGKPLVAWPIQTGHATKAIDRTIVSTDSDEIAAAARAYDAEVIDRPTEIATDDALVVDTIRHTVSQLCTTGECPEYMVMLEPTSPLRTPADVNACLERLRVPETDFDSVATFTEAEVNPHRTWRVEGETPEPFLDEANPWLPRQQQPDAYQLNGAVYAFSTEAISDEGSSLLFGTPGAVLMPPERSVDIDTPVDFALAETLLAKRETND